MKFRLLAVVLGVAVVVPMTFGIDAQPDEKMEVARDVATQVGQILGSARACPDIAPGRIKTMGDKLEAVLNFATTNADDLGALQRLYEKNVGDGQRAVTERRKDCAAAARDLTELESAIRTPAAAPSGVTASSRATPPASAAAVAASPPVRTVGTSAVAANVAAPPDGRTRAVAGPVAPVPTPPSPMAALNVNAPVRGVSADEIRFGIAAPFSGTTRDLGLQMKLGIDVAFREANARGGVNGRMLRLVAADDGYEPVRTIDAMKDLYDADQVFGIIGNVGTPTAAVSLPFALEHRMLFYGAFSGANLLRNDPPDRYVFNYRASYAEETDAVVRYLVRLRKLKPEQIAVFAQQDAFGDSGFAGVTKAMRALRGGDEGNILRLGYKRNTIDVDDAVNRLRQTKGAIKAVVMVATYRAAAKFIEKTRDSYPGMLYTNVSFVGSTSLAEELMLLGPRFANGVIVTQVVPPIESYASIVLDYKSALAAYSSTGDAPDYVSFEGYLAAKVLVEGLRRAVPALDTEKVVDALESLRDYDIGLGVPITFSRTEHQAVHKVWGTQLDDKGKYQSIELQ
jgi:ABC-type branched-subunit amino acid transport system substrate-binding protein